MVPEEDEDQMRKPGRSGGDSGSCPRRLVGRLGMEESATFDGGSWSSVFHPDLHGARRAGAFGKPFK